MQQYRVTTWNGRTVETTGALHELAEEVCEILGIDPWEPSPRCKVDRDKRGREERTYWSRSGEFLAAATPIQRA